MVEMRVVGGMAVSFAAARAAMCTLHSTLDRRPYTWNLSYRSICPFHPLLFVHPFTPPHALHAPHAIHYRVTEGSSTNAPAMRRF